MIWVALAVAIALGYQQGARLSVVRDLESNVPAFEEQVRAAGMTVSHSTVVVPVLWPFTGPAYVCVHFGPPGGSP